MGSFSNYLENKLLDHTLKVASFTQPTNIYVALSTTDPTDAGTAITEPSGNAYARTLCNTWDTAASGASANTSAITFPTATGSWGTITHFALYDASTGGNMLGHGSVGTPQAVTTGNTPQFAAGDLDVTLD